MIQDAIRQAVDHKDLTAEVARAVMAEMMSGAATQSQIGSFVTAMRMKGETEEELRGFVMAMRDGATRIRAPEGAVDLCGTGGDGSGTLNISTIASFAVAGAGVPVAKHGNRSVSSRSGSADLLDALGIPFDLDPASVEMCMRTAGIGFMFAPVFHSSMRNVLAPRREIGIRTFFNILGPMANPAGVKHQLVGVYDPKLVPLVAGVLRDLGTERAMVVHGNGTDEITTTGKTLVAELDHGRVEEYSLDPGTFGIDSPEPEALSGGLPLDNARAALAILRGERSPRADIVALNAAAAVYISGKAEDIHEALDLVRSVVRNGHGMAKLREFSRTAMEMEAERQAKQDIASLRTRKVLPEVLTSRCAEFTAELVKEIASLDGGQDALRFLDPSLVSSPSVLSVLAANRMLRVMKDDFTPPGEMQRSALKMSEALSSPSVSIIGEYKPRSPSAPPLRVPPEPMAAADAYRRAGVAAVSVLIEPDFFGGGPELFAQFRSRLALPMLFKDFVVSRRQVELARMLGADAVLLIAKALTHDALDELVHACASAGMEPLAEVHDAEDVKKLTSCASFGSIRMVGVNCRDLRTMVIRNRRRLLREMLPKDRVVVAESGVRSPDDVHSLKGFSAVLVGSALMDAQDVGKAAEALVAAGRSVTI